MSELIDLAGIGVGPFNLSLAALLDGIADFRALFFERKAGFAWHPGQLLPGARLQTSFLKDLVTPVDPTSPHSFLNYIRDKRRFYEFLNADQGAVLRAEFADYLGWVAGRLPSLRFGWGVEEVRLEGPAFRLKGRVGNVGAQSIVIGTGRRPYVPAWVQNAPHGSFVHSSRALVDMPRLEGRHVAIVGGGQSGAELFLEIARAGFGAPERVTWITRRATFAALDETNFVNEWFTPGFVERFHGLPWDRREALMPVQKLAGDGISLSTIREIYDHLYERRHVVGDGHRLILLPAREVVGLRRAGTGSVLHLRDGLEGREEILGADVIVLATGFVWELPECLAPLRHRLELDRRGFPCLDLRFRLAWDGPPEARIYVQNGGQRSHGIADPQLSLMAWRAASIANDVTGRRLYDLEEVPPPVRWARIERPLDAGAALSVQGG